MARSSKVRKQLYIRRDQDQDLKRVARQRGVSEAALVRQAIDALLQGAEASSISQQKAVEALVAANLAGGERPGATPVDFSRDEVYQEREGRWS